MERSAGLQLDGRGRLLVYPVSGIAHAAPAQLLLAETSDDALGEAILTAIAASEPDREEWEANHRRAPNQLRAARRQREGLPRLPERGVHRAATPAEACPLIDLHGWKPAKGGWDPFDAEQMSVPSTDPAALGRAARNVLARIPVTRRTQHGERTGVAFGYKTAWLAARTDDTAAVARALQLTQVTELSWEEGIEASDHDVVFVSPPTEGWVLAVGFELADHPPDVVALSAQLGTEVQFFATHRVVEAHHWEHAATGTLKRRLRYVGERNEAQAIGEPTAIERALGLDWTTERPSPPPDEAAVPDEETVMQVAAAWGIDPRELADTPTSSNTGLAGHLPHVETEHPQGRGRLLERIDRLIASLSQPLSRAERKAGWSPEAATALLEHFEQVRDRLRASGALDPRTLPAGEQALRGMDAWGIDIASDSPLMREVLNLSHELRRAGLAGNQ
jgi:hypothetical protein